MRYGFGVLVLALLGVACSKSDSSASSSSGSNGAANDSGDIPIEAAANPFVLTSTAFVEGGAIPDANSCTGNINQSPPLAWTGAPSGTKSFALTLVDKTNNLVHAVAYDIPSTLTSLPAAVEKAYAPSNVSGMHQTTGYDNTTRGYLGPCPPEKHTYTFTLYALDEATLTGATMATTRDQAVALIGVHNLGFARLTGTYVKP